MAGDTAMAEVCHKALHGAKNLVRIDLSGMKVKEAQLVDICKTLCTLDKLVTARMDDVLASKNASADVLRILS